MKKIFFLMMLGFLLCGCAKQEAPAPVQTTAPAVLAEAPTEIIPIIVETEAVALAEAPPPPVSVVLQPEHPGTLEERCEAAVVDYSHTGDGYIMACYLEETDKRLKVRVQGRTTTYTYNLTPGQWEVFPLSDGEGQYRVSLYKNTSGSKYASVMAASFDVQLKDEFAPFLRPNQYVNYISQAENTVRIGAELCSGIQDPLEKVAVVYDYVVTKLHYDHEKAATVKSGYLPVLDEVLELEKGICFDYAAVMTAMLRSQQIPCKLVVGYAGKTYHAWISVWTEENGWVDGAIFFDGQTWKRMDPTFASSGQRSDDIMDYIENGQYTVKYLY